MTQMDDGKGGVTRRHALECMIWAGTGLLWTVAGGVPKSLSFLDSAEAAEASGFTFLQISDSHVGFDKPANPHAVDTLKEAIAKVSALKTKPAFMIHTGDITHLSKPEQFDIADQIIGSPALMCIMCRASMTSSMRPPVKPIFSVTASRPKVLAGIPSTIMACTS
jgi:hypothetical protein